GGWALQIELARPRQHRARGLATDARAAAGAPQSDGTAGARGGECGRGHLLGCCRGGGPGARGGRGGGRGRRPGPAPTVAGEGCGEEVWPDGTVAGRYWFTHALYREVAYHRLPAARRVQLHRRIGEREEACYGPQGRERAAELAMHFVRGRDFHRAVRYLQYA